MTVSLAPVKKRGISLSPLRGERVPSELASEAGEGRLWMPLTAFSLTLESRPLPAQRGEEKGAMTKRINQ